MGKRRQRLLEIATFATSSSLIVAGNRLCFCNIHPDGKRVTIPSGIARASIPRYGDFPLI
jgi:hypothetical protein